MLAINAMVYRETDGRFTAEIPACPGCAASGTTRDEALANLREAAALYFEDETAAYPSAPAFRSFAGASAPERVAL